MSTIKSEPKRLEDRTDMFTTMESEFTGSF